MPKVPPFHCCKPSDWDPDEDELHRVRDRVLPGVEIRFVDPPTEPVWAAIARFLVAGGAGPTARWNHPDVCGPFLRIWPQAKTPMAVVAAARKLLGPLSEVAPIQEAVLLVPCRSKPPLDPGPAWARGWRVRSVDPALPEPRLSVAMDAVFGDQTRAAIAARMWVAEITGQPREIDGLGAAIAAAGCLYPDAQGRQHLTLEIIRVEDDPGEDWERHSVLGLLEDGRWAWILTGAKLKKGQKRGTAYPRNLLLFGPSRREFEAALASGLTRHGLEIDAPIPIDEMLRSSVEQFIAGSSLHSNVFRWLAVDPMLNEPRVQEALHARRDDQYMKRDIALLLRS